MLVPYWTGYEVDEYHVKPRHRYRVPHLAGNLTLAQQAVAQRLACKHAKELWLITCRARRTVVAGIAFPLLPIVRLLPQIPAVVAPSRVIVPARPTPTV